MKGIHFLFGFGGMGVVNLFMYSIGAMVPRPDHPGYWYTMVAVQIGCFCAGLAMLIEKHWMKK